MKLRTLFLGLSFVLFPVLGAQAQAGWMSYHAEIEQWCQSRLGSLTRPDGYLALTGLHWLSAKPESFEGIGKAHLQGQDVVFEFEPGVTLDGKSVNAYRVGPEAARGTPDFHHGTSHFFVIRHGQRIGLRVKDPNSRTLKEFAGVERFPIDRQWRIVARFEAKQATIPVASVVDELTDEVSPGYAVFEHDGKSYKLRLMGEQADESYFLVFSDASAGKTTYSGMRFLDVEKAADGSLVLDFNKAENPPCSMTPFATCPLPPQGNVLPFEVTAGELTPKIDNH